MLYFKKNIFLILLQTTIMFIVWLWAYYPFAYGKEVSLKVMPIDPRSLTSGQYVRLSLEFSQLDQSLLDGDSNLLKAGQPLLVELQEHRDLNGFTIYKPIKLHLSTKKESLKDKTFIEVRFIKKFNDKIRLETGLESFFTNPKRALELENLSRNSDLKLKVKISKDGRAVIEDIVF